MSISALARELARVPIFSGLEPLQLTEIVRSAERIVFAKGQRIIEHGQAGEQAVFISSGQIKRLTSVGDEKFDGDILDAGCLIGEMMMLIESRYTATVVAQSHVYALGIKRSAMLELMLADKRIAEHFVEKIRTRLAVFSNDLANISQNLPGQQNQQNLQTLAS